MKVDHLLTFINTQYKMEVSNKMKGNVNKRGKTYQYVVDIGRDPITGKRKQKTKGGFKRQKDAQAALNKVLHEIGEQGYVEPSKEIFSSFIEE